MSRIASFALTLLISTIVGFAATTALSAPIASGDLIAVTNTQFCCSPTVAPNVYQLDSSGAFKSFSFSPFFPSDIAVDKAGRVLYGSSGSGNIVLTDTSGAFLGFLSTPVSQVNGLGVANDGSLFVASGNSIYHLDAQGHFLGLTFSPVSFNSSTPLGVLGNDTVVFVDPATTVCCGPSNVGLDLFDTSTRVLSHVTTPLTSITGLDVSETGQFWVAGSTSGFFGSPSNTIFELNSAGAQLKSIVGPENMSALAIANLPEPSVGLLLGLGLSILAVGRRR